jgi:hypothetical protein
MTAVNGMFSGFTVPLSFWGFLPALYLLAALILVFKRRSVTTQAFQEINNSFGDRLC